MILIITDEVKLSHKHLQTVNPKYKQFFKEESIFKNQAKLPQTFSKIMTPDKTSTKKIAKPRSRAIKLRKI